MSRFIRFLMLAVVLSLWLGLPAQGEEFLRGDIDGDGRVVPILDAQRLLMYWFDETDEIEEPPCLDAADSDGNGDLSGLRDSLFVLNWAFNGGDEPPAPGPEECSDVAAELTCEVEPDCDTPDPDLEIDDSVTLRVSSAEVDEDDATALLGVELVSETYDITGLQFGLCHDAAVVCVNLDDILLTDDALETEFIYRLVTADADGWYTALLTDVTDRVAMESGSTLDLFTVVYTIVDEGETAIEFCDYQGNESIPVRAFTFVSKDTPVAEIIPSTADGSIIVEGFTGEDVTCEYEGTSTGGNGSGKGNKEPEHNGVDPLCELATSDGDYDLSLSDATGLISTTATIELRLHNSGCPISAFAMGVCHDADLVSIEENDIVLGEDITDLPVLFETATAYDSSFVAAAFFSPFGDSALGQGEDLSLYELEYSLLELGTSTIEFCETGDPAVELIFSVLVEDFPEDVYESYIPGTTNGSIEIIEPQSFIRGDIDGSGTVSGLPDVLFLLNWAFLEDEEPGCMDAADIDDNGTVSALTDAFLLLRYAFLEEAPPEEPFEECGLDPTDDDITCLEGSEGCD